MRLRCSSLRDARGVTVVELLVVLTILAVVGSIIALSMTRGLEADAQARDRLEAFESMQIGMERMTREIRQANPPAGEPILTTAESKELEFQVRRGGTECLEFRYTFDEVSGAVIDAQRECGTATWAEVVLLRGIDLDANDEVDGIFTFWPEERAVDSEEIEPLDPDDPDFDVGRVAFVEITFVRALVLDQRPVTVNTVVGLRNR